jgi:hypothetical protein
VKHTATLALMFSLAMIIALSSADLVVAAAGVSLGDYVWEDLNHNGLQDDGEPGIAGVTVHLYRITGGTYNSYLGAVQTDANGYYLFTGLSKKPWYRYYVVFDRPVGYEFTVEGNGSNDTADSDADTLTGETTLIDLSLLSNGDDRDITWDAGVYASDHDSPGCGTPGYWMNHPEAWPVEEIVIGGVTYTKCQARAIMRYPNERDMTYQMFAHLVAAKLNVLIGNDPAPIMATIEAADVWLTAYPLASGVKAGAKDSPWEEGEPLKDLLDQYNNGLLGPPARD